MATLAACDPGHGIHLRSGVKTSLSDHSYCSLINIHQGARLSSSPERPEATAAKLMNRVEDHGKSSLSSAYLSTGGANSRSAQRFAPLQAVRAFEHKQRKSNTLKDTCP